MSSKFNKLIALLRRINPFKESPSRQAANIDTSQYINLGPRLKTKLALGVDRHNNILIKFLSFDDRKKLGAIIFYNEGRMEICGPAIVRGPLHVEGSITSGEDIEK